MEPASLSNLEWTEIGKFLTSMWIMLGLVASFAASMLIGHVFIPSLVASDHLPASLQKTRPLFYLLSIAFIGLAVLVLIRAIDLSDVIGRIYDDYWI